ncbi:asparagine synthase C-terminal domain-containing protein [Lewinella cohaerens]|uniref:asparagine synthase C-terminal domain-containing protein n=1 Tax=Lewinella cohaerens TaxID=70995 RepID=UPI00037FD3FD|nr:asparagine synthase C-terminal domain-containing protein [Lewinella cohaerens]
MIDIQIKQQKRVWHSLSDGWWTGHVYYQQHWLSPKEVEQLLLEVASTEALSALLQQWNGSFALIWTQGERTFAATDIARSIPLFWSVRNKEIKLNNHLLPADGTLLKIHEDKAFAQTEFIPGHTTLLHGWQQLQAGELLEIHNNRCYLHNYFPHRRPAPFRDSPSVLKQQFGELLEDQIDRLIAFAAGREIVIPLSGGYDSRILLTILQQKQYPALKAFTYGQEGSWEVEIARSVATKLGVDWQFVPYTKELLQQFGDQNWKDFANFSGNLSSIPQEQDYFALRFLKAAGWLKKDSIICPGYCGDFQAGSYLPDSSFSLRPKRLKALQNFLYQRFIRYPSPTLRQLWQSYLPQAELSDEHNYVSELEHWVLREYVSKFIINGVRAYEWFDCTWYLPLWDLEFIRFWQQIPNGLRIDMQMYREVLEDNWFRPQQLIFPKDQKTKPLFRPLASYLPLNLKRQLKKILPTKPQTNINGLHQLVPMIQAALGWPQPDLTKSVNEMIGYWYHHEITKASNNH